MVHCVARQCVFSYDNKSADLGIFECEKRSKNCSKSTRPSSVGRAGSGDDTIEYSGCRQLFLTIEGANFAGFL